MSHDEMIPECQVRWDDLHEFKVDQKDDHREIWKRLNRLDIKVSGLATLGGIIGSVIGAFASKLFTK